MNENALFYIALTRVKGVGSRTAIQLLESFKDPEEIFHSADRELKERTRLGKKIIEEIRSFQGLEQCRRELLQLQDRGIQVVTIDDTEYPISLQHIPDRPIVLYMKGSSTSYSRNIAIVGTRIPSRRAEKMVRNLIKDLGHCNCNIVSGLAYGVDRMAHESAVELGIPTSAVLGHSLDRIYPGSHSALARSIIEKNGNLISEHSLGVKPDRENFPMRNRIVAGMCDATIVVESKIRGGSLITADLAFQYHRDVFAVPGRPEDESSAGCLDLIRKNKAQICTSAEDVIRQLNWDTNSAAPKQRDIPLDLNEHQMHIWKALQEAAPLHIDELLRLTGLRNSEIATELLNLELRGLIRQNPGNSIDIR